MGKSLQPAAPGAPLGGAFDLEHAVLATPEQARTKGMFFAPLRAELGEEWDALASKLESPPRAGRYLGFADYPSRDHVRLIDAAARKRYPHLAPREAHRRLGAESFSEFAKTTFGRVALQLIASDLTKMFLRFGEGYDMLVKRTRPVRTSILADGGVRIVFEDSLSMGEYVLGILEAMVQRASRTPRIEVRVEPAGTVFDVRWG